MFINRQKPKTAPAILASTSAGFFVSGATYWGAHPGVGPIYEKAMTFLTGEETKTDLNVGFIAAMFVLGGVFLYATLRYGKRR